MQTTKLSVIILSKFFLIAFSVLCLSLSLTAFSAPNKNAYKNANENASFKKGKNDDRDNIRDDIRDKYDDDRIGDHRYDRDDRQERRDRRDND